MRVIAVVLATLLWPVSGFGQTLWLITIAATKDPAVGRGADANRSAMLELMSGIANQLHMRFEGEALSNAASGANFSCDNIRTVLGKMAPGPKDTLVFSYSGHGERRFDDTSPLPALACNDPDDPHPRRLPLQEAVRLLMTKRARLTLVIADMCNFALESSNLPSVAGLGAPEITAYRRLMLESAGVVVLDSSSPGEFSWYDPTGGRFTQQFVTTMKNPPGGARATWDSFVAKVTEAIPVSTVQVPLDPQTGKPLLSPGQAVLESPQALVRLTASPQ